MNYQETLTRLEEEKKSLEDKVNDSDRNTRELNKRKLDLIEKLIKGYSKSSTEEVSSDKINEVFSKVYGFTKQKEEAKNLLLNQKWFKAKGIENEVKGKSLCLVGPPGVGKTYFAEIFAEALGRKYYRINLGGASSAIIITGGEEMWIGSKQGEIVNAIIKTQNCNPVVLLDEIEKSGRNTHHGTIEDALLHVIDPEQNEHFKEHFLDVEIDISQITFVATANELEKISDPLKNRLEIIKLEEYDEEQKMQIGKILIDKIFQKDYKNTNRDLFEMNEEALRVLIKKTEEPGVRQLEKKLTKIVGWCASQWIKSLERGEEEQKMVIDEDKVNELFPKEEDEKEVKDEETKLRDKNKELSEEIEDLKKEKINLGLLSPLEISQDKEFCEKHQKNTLQSSDKNCLLCKLEEQVKKFMDLISQENQKKVEQIWTERKLEWMKQEANLQSGSEEEREIGQQIKQSIKKIDEKLQRAGEKGGSTGSQPSQPNWIGKNWIWLVGGGIIILFLIGGLVWIFLKSKKKKKNKNSGKGQLTTENWSAQTLQLPEDKKNK